MKACLYRNGLEKHLVLEIENWKYKYVWVSLDGNGSIVGPTFSNSLADVMKDRYAKHKNFMKCEDVELDSPLVKYLLIAIEMEKKASQSINEAAVQLFKEHTADMPAEFCSSTTTKSGGK